MSDSVQLTAELKLPVLEELSLRLILLASISVKKRKEISCLLFKDEGVLESLQRGEIMKD